MNIYLIPFIAAFIGWLANWLLIKIAFQNIGKRKNEFAAKLGNIVANELVNLDIIADKLKEPGKLDSIKPTIETHIDTFLRVKLLEKMPFLSTFIGESTLVKLKDGMMEEIEALLPVVISQYAGSLVDQINIEQLVSNKIKNLPEGKMEGMLKSGMNKELNMLKMAGAVSGFAIGLVSILLTLI
jgi:uncharacterized membrane protein YheB (UPF0754 family)